MTMVLIVHYFLMNRIKMFITAVNRTSFCLSVENKLTLERTERTKISHVVHIFHIKSYIILSRSGELLPPLSKSIGRIHEGILSTKNLQRSN